MMGFDAKAGAEHVYNNYSNMVGFLAAIFVVVSMGGKEHVSYVESFFGMFQQIASFLGLLHRI
jgi:hypothetical protein